ncbi:ATP synthase regulation protein NCA2-domain-containing protein [Microdochium trichocladiopsis]|uniref:ATP synthase regulation protein NCA2-domain-containing protein n=1 Tax=Microdochium trichocladiopsis TaxID=1682393 RepID=A0A9P8YCU4_9PEZI|nr:ATP synthase regulation protein NCA2-domain-containing protein [Microdochium trichocladiopsis]KAH7035570.1 ATP synthase regulation protein NCA2-domain-containing protein [Microdochium trichocladiopsis]
MSVIDDQVRRLDAQLDRIPFNHLAPPGHGEASGYGAEDLNSPRVRELLRIIKTLSTTSGTHAHLHADQLQSLLYQSNLLANKSDVYPATHYEAELQWLLVSKATVRTYGIVLRTLLDQIIPLSNHIWYWDDVVSSNTYSTVYMIQTSPARFWSWSWDIYQDSRVRLQQLATRVSSKDHDNAEGRAGSQSVSLSQGWRQFYSIVQETVRERSLANVQRRIMSPVAQCRAEARRKQHKLKRLREMTASGLGVLIDEGLAFGGNGSDDGKSDLIMSHNQEWKGVVERSVALMDMVLRDVLTMDMGVSDFEDKVFQGVEEDPELSIQVEEDDSTRPTVVARRLQNLIQKHLPSHVAEADSVITQNGRPSRLTRYWLPMLVLTLSSSTILRILVNRKQAVIEWIRGFGETVQDFWFNWVVEPVRKVIGTIRHDQNSEIALMSRDSLRADRASLERMVVDFAVDRPASATGASSLSESQIAEIRAKVKEGDLTPVLRAYENDLRRPVMGTIRGDLVRTLLIQVQKTKVDVEVAMAGIDSLLKSQELVFGFVGLTPGILVSVSAFRYLRTALGGRKGMTTQQKVGKCVRVLRNIDRIFSEATPSPNNVLSYKDHGLLVCEVHVLRELAHSVLPSDIEKEFLEDVDDLANLKGIQQQLRALDRIRWAYARWLQ